jgi:Antibiotic biosynthesis monooxygenase
MFATIRRYESVEPGRASEVVKKVDEELAPSLRELPGFHGYYLVDAGDGVLTSIGLFDTQEHADDSTDVASRWIGSEQLHTALPKAPKITRGEVVVQNTVEVVQA